MIRPRPPRPSTARPKAWERKNTALRLTSTTASQIGFGEVYRVRAADDPGIVH